MFIDIHAHAQRIEGAPRHGVKPWASIRQVIARYDALGIERGVIQPLIGPEFYEPQSNQDILDMAAAHPDRVIPFFCLHPRAIANSHETDFRPLIEYYLERGCKGFGEATFNLPWLHPLVNNLLKQINEFELLFCFHLSDRQERIYGFADEPGMPQLEISLKRFPKIKFLAHSPVFWAEIGKLETPEDRSGYPRYEFQEEGTVPKLMRRYENLYGDLSANSGYNALARNPDYAARFLDEFQDRLLFGTDICAPETSAPLADFLLEMRKSRKISETVFRKVARENAVRLLKLDIGRQAANPKAKKTKRKNRRK